MSEQELLTDLSKRGLTPWQAHFVVGFLNGAPAPYQLLAAPPGTGKMYATVAVVRELAGRGAERILILAPASVCEMWSTRIHQAQSELSVINVARRTYREMVAAVAVGQSPWTAGGVYVTSQDFAKQPDIAAGLSAVTWDLVTVDEAHRLVAPQRAALLDLMESQGALRRLLLLTATPLPALESWLHPSPAEPAPLWAPPTIVNWYGRLRNWDGSVVTRPRFEWRTVQYTRGPDEVRFINGLRDVTGVLVASGVDPFVPQILDQRAASSTFAAELTLQRLYHTLRSQDATVASSTDDTELHSGADTEDMELQQSARAAKADVSSALKTIEQCLEALEFVSTDEKLNALKELLRASASATLRLPVSICVVSQYADTIGYLYSALAESSTTTVFKVTGRDSFADRAATIEQFRSVGGLLVATDGAISEGIELGDVVHVVHYDVPLSAEAVEQRFGRFLRYGRTQPLTMYRLVDDSGAVPSEMKINERLDALRFAFDTYTEHSAEPRAEH